MGLRATVANYTLNQVVGGVTGTRTGRRWLLAAQGAGKAPGLPEADIRSLWAHWCLHGVAVLGGVPAEHPRITRALANGSRFRRWLWLWTGL